MKRAIPRLEVLIVAAAFLALGLGQAEAAPKKVPGSGLYQLGKTGADGPVAKVRDECCSDPGAIAECWWQDAERDGVTCTVPANCTAGHACITDPAVYNGHVSPNGVGLCECTDNADCNDGVNSHGVCDTDRGICGPSYCNGYRACSCFGGCEDVFIEGHATPKEYCATQPNDQCCEHFYPKIPGTEQTGMCWTSINCDQPPTSTTDTGECTDAADCTDFLGNICVQAACILNTCQYGGDPLTRGKCFDLENGGVELTVNTDPIDPDPANVLCCCTAAGDCPTDPCIAGATCNLDNADTNYYHSCEVIQEGAGASCTGADADNPCHWWACDNQVRRDCALNERNVDVGCEDSSAGRANTDCAAWICRGADGVRDCEFATDILYKQSCDPALPPSVCGYRFCDDMGACVLAKILDDPLTPAVNEGDTCAPEGVADYHTLYCYEFQCDSTENCSAGAPLPYVHSEPNREDCTYHDTDRLGNIATSGTITRSEDMTCAIDYVKLAGSGTNPRFGSCDMVDISDFVYYYIGQAGFEGGTSHEFSLRHVLAYAKATGTLEWDPIIYTTTACDYDPNSQFTCNDECDFGPVAMTKFNDNGYSCGVAPLDSPNTPKLGETTAAVTAGPWPLQDVPVYSGAGWVNDRDGNLFDDGFATTDDWEGWVVVDSAQPTAPYPPGGEFDLTVEYNEHKNNSCWNTASFMATPQITGEQDWKERWRGNLNGYDNFLCESDPANPNILDANGDCIDDDTNNDISSGCWSGGLADVAADDPGQAFYRVDLPEGLYKAYLDEAGLMWSASGYVNRADNAFHAGTPTEGADFMSAVLATWGNGSTMDGPCVGALNPSAGSNQCSGGPRGWPRERFFDNGPGGWHGWLEVSNNNPGLKGDYELNVLRVPQPMHGIVDVYTGRQSGGGGCNCGNPPDPYTGGDLWNLEGTRVDFVPVDTELTGYALIAKAVSTGPNQWLVDPDIGIAGGAIARDVVCYGAACKTAMGPLELPFLFPMTGELFSHYCIQGAGAVALRRSGDPTTDPCPPWHKSPGSKDFTGQYDDPVPALRGYAPIVAPLWGRIAPCFRSTRVPIDLGGWDTTIWNSCRSGYEGRIVRQVIPFEGTTAMVITWDGFDGDLNPSTWRSNRDNSLQFQVVLRVDGRISFYYKEPDDYAGAATNSWDWIHSHNGWMIGVAGTRSARCDDYNAGCASDGDCQPGFTCNVGSGVCGMTSGADTHCVNQLGAGASCDNDNTHADPGDTSSFVIYAAQDFCMQRDINVFSTGLAGP